MTDREFLETVTGGVGLGERIVKLTLIINGISVSVLVVLAPLE
jgi:hypothetical protein